MVRSDALHGHRAPPLRNDCLQSSELPDRSRDLAVREADPHRLSGRSDVGHLTEHTRRPGSPGRGSGARGSGAAGCRPQSVQADEHPRHGRPKHRLDRSARALQARRHDDRRHGARPQIGPRRAPRDRWSRRGARGARTPRRREGSGRSGEVHRFHIRGRKGRRPAAGMGRGSDLRKGGLGHDGHRRQRLRYTGGCHTRPRASRRRARRDVGPTRSLRGCTRPG